MEKKEVLNLHLLISEEKSESLYPMYFGVSCAFFALRLLSVPDEDENRCLIREKMIQGSAQLLGLLIWRAQKEWQKADLLRKLEIAEREIEKLKRIRREDAKANEKVVGIFATQEQSWFVERKKLRHHLGRLMNDMSKFEKKKEEEIFEMSEKLKEMDVLLQAKDKAMEEEMKNRKDLEKKLSQAENLAENLRERAKDEARDHSSELWKHKTAFIELVSNQRQFESETRRSLRQVDAIKQELDSVLLQKEDSVLLVEKLSAEVVRMSKDLDEKDKILSVMLRKLKFNRAEKQMLLNEFKLSKAKRKQAELETERWKSVSESRHERQSLRNIISNHPEFINDLGQQLDDPARSEPEKEALMVVERHSCEIDALVEQMRVKDEKWEAFRWKLLSMELETKRLKDDNLKLEASLIGPEKVDDVQTISVKLELPTKKSIKTSNTPLRMDLHALGVSFKIKRLKQELLMAERVAGNEEDGMKDFILLMNSLNKQVRRYLSLQAKADDLCRRTHESNEAETGDPEREMLLEETFQLQRYIVATGQKLMEIKSKIASAFSENVDRLNNSYCLDTKRFSESLGMQFQEVQRGLEVRIARIIGDLEGTLACEGMICLGRKIRFRSNFNRNCL